jgi:hypothetical protein
MAGVIHRFMDHSTDDRSPHEYDSGKDPDVPKATKPDF